MKNLKEIDFSISDFLKLGTLLSVGLIISYQVGYYQELGFQFFTILSLQDHIMIFLKLTPLVFLTQAFSFSIGISLSKENITAKESPVKKDRIGAYLFDAIMFIVLITITFSSHSWYSVMGYVAMILWFKFGLI